MPTIDLTLTPPPARRAGGFRLGTPTRTDGSSISADNLSLLKNGQPWTPVMGEIHYARVRADRWRDELLKMRAGGIDVVATYLFWVHHEEHEGVFDFAGDKNVRRFVELCGELGLCVVVRLGPWCHGEVIHGGVPAWALRFGKALRTSDPDFLAVVRRLYSAFYEQLRGLLWKDGGPIVGAQVDNEYFGPAQYLLDLKRLAIGVGFDVPFYTRTGWPALSTPMPFGELLPLHGAYAEGFWDRSYDSMPGKYHRAFRFVNERDDSAIATDHFGQRDAKDDHTVADYPYLTCELGGGMMSSYHRRIHMLPKDIEAAALVKLGSGSALLGYYMYHGGTNPRPGLHEHQDTPFTNYNDLPTMNYDFQAPLGALGQARPHYHGLRMLHHFVHTYGATLSSMTTQFVEQVDPTPTERETLRWSVRTDGRASFIFINNHQRSLQMQAHRDVNFVLKNEVGEIVATFAEPFDVPANSAFVLPLNLRLSDTVTLVSATAQPVTMLKHDVARVHIFAEIEGVTPRFHFADEPAIHPLVPNRDVAMTCSDGTAIVLLSAADARRLSRHTINGQEVLVLCDACVASDGGMLKVFAENDAPLELTFLVAGAQTISLSPEYGDTRARGVSREVSFQLSRTGVGEVTFANGAAGVTEAPRDDAVFDTIASEWTIDLDPALLDRPDPILRLEYVGDVARVYLGSTLLVDDYFNGDTLDVGLAPYLERLRTGERLSVRILPLRLGAPIFYPAAVRERCASHDGNAMLNGVTLIGRPVYTIPLSTRG